MNGPISQSMAMAVPDGVSLVVEGVEKCLGKEDELYGSKTVSQTQLSELLNRDQSVVSRNVHKAIELGFLVNENPGQGRVARLCLGERKLPNGAVLPTVEELFEPEKAYAYPTKELELA